MDERTRFDSYPYRNRLSDVVAWEPLDIGPEASLAEAAAAMSARDVGSILVRGSGGCHEGILTERDIMRLVAAGKSPGIPVSEVMSSPVQALPADTLIYKAMGRMERLGIRHLAVTDAEGRIIGVVSLRTILKTRNTAAFALGDAIESAPDAAAIAAARTRLPALVRALLHDATRATTVAGAISAAMRDSTERAGLLAEASMERDGLGKAPAPYALLVLGSGGRGESLLSPDQDNAVIFDGSGEEDAWFAEWGKRLADILNEAGVPYCNGGVMASNSLWRGTPADWRERVAGWVRSGRGESIMNVDIFFDFAPVLGDAALAAALRHDAVEAVSRQTVFLGNLVQHIGGFRPPLAWDAFGLLSGFQLKDGRVDLKIGGTLPLVAAARVLALRHGVEAVSTIGRLNQLREKGVLSPGDAAAASEALEAVMDAILRQQLADLEDGIAPSSKIDPSLLDRRTRRALRNHLAVVDLLQPMVQGAVSG
ncbi:DUF294 nucleotidyltransferase-like domain-containing protein [Nisaea acidiphila]|uniref:DUF294 nucleotidyltransferase-like domain-containing protein n=1 Tax=Nisaea acidiphila TaxID=1862145 RepID=A0A9J7AN52_9PROT|nr:DUF294 nucleotidyltransferase-like domain-containing protein [Nisaea acidiphila]UUX49067.1 DUF294 nucleotidyltransferase-like domain-containing protein [Nisaea acidiphila]